MSAETARPARVPAEEQASHALEPVARPVTVLPVAAPRSTGLLARRMTDLVKSGLKNPAVVVSATAVATVLAELGRRRLDHLGSVPSLRTAQRVVDRGSVLVTETLTVTRSTRMTRLR